MVAKTPDHIEDRVVELRNEWLSIRKIQDRIQDELDVSIWHWTVHRILERCKEQLDERKEALKWLEKDLEDKLYDHDDENLYVYTRKINHLGEKESRRHEIPFDVVNPMVRDYVRKGNNMTQQQVMDKYGLKDKVWNALKSALNLTKHSWVCNEVYLRVLEDKYGEEEMIKYIDETAFKTVEDKYKRLEVDRFDKAKEREIEKAISILRGRENWLDQLNRYLTTYEPIKVNFKRKELKNNDVYDVGMSDFHFWYQSNNVAIRMHRATNYLINRPESNINLMCLWDLVENIVPWGEMHVWQQQHQDMFGFELMMFTVKQFESMLLELYKANKIITFTGIAGNHDRLAKNHGEDIQEMWAQVMYELIKRWLEQCDIDIQYLSEKTNTYDTSQIRYILHHGHEKFSNKAQRNPDKILRDHGSKEKPNVVMYGDKHNINVRETNNATIVGLPAFADRWEYTKRLDLYSEPWLVWFKKNEHGKIDLDIKRL